MKHIKTTGRRSGDCDDDGGTASAAIVSNGGFEDLTGAQTSTSGNGSGTPTQAELLVNDLITGNWGVFGSIPDWTSTSGTGIEVQTAPTLTNVNPRTGSFYVELDSNGPGLTNSAMEQSVSLQAGSTYLLEFWYTPRVANNPGTNIISYGIAGSSFAGGTVTGPPPGVGTWSLVSQHFTVDADGDYLLQFAALGNDDFLGGFIDDISISAVPLPAAGFLLLGAMGGLGFMSRKRKAA